MWDVLWTQKTTQTRLKQWIFSFFFITTAPTTRLYASFRFIFLRNTHLHICVYSWGPSRVCGDLWRSKKGQKWGKIACFGVNPPSNSKPRCPSCPCCDILKVQRYAKQFQLEMKPEEMCGRCYRPKKRQKHTYNSGFLVFSCESQLYKRVCPSVGWSVTRFFFTAETACIMFD